MPTKIKYQLLVSFCLMSLLPLLAGVYAASLFIKYPLESNEPQALLAVSLVTLCSLIIAALGFSILRQMMKPVLDAKRVAAGIAKGDFEIDSGKVEGSEELQDLSNSLRTITQNAKDLLEKVERLSLKDKLTGLYNANYIRERLDEEIQRAIHYQRPCSFAYFAIGQFETYASAHGLEISQEALKVTANILSRHLAEFDRAARLGGTEFVMIFPDKNKKKAIEVAQKICGEFAAYPFFGKEKIQLDLFAGISENPIDGVTAAELFSKARQRVRAAGSGRSGRIEAFA